ncbi:MAG: type II toxin-antitoxin system PemK/MazF family toxin [Chloroflexi bacterium]|nr:type II toxin-antitoxin system PemK/MazF family toxin [Chloroflexota bacterium]
MTVVRPVLKPISSTLSDRTRPGPREPPSRSAAVSHSAFIWSTRSGISIGRAIFRVAGAFLQTRRPLREVQTCQGSGRSLEGLTRIWRLDQAKAAWSRSHEVRQDRNGLEGPSRIMVDKITSVRKSRLGRRVGRLDDEDVVRLNQAILVFLGFA